MCENKSFIPVAGSILLYSKVGGKVLPGLIRRRQTEGDLFLNVNNNNKPSLI